MVEVVEVSDVELLKLDFKVSLTEDIVPPAISTYYYSISLSYDERYFAFLISDFPYDKIAIWDVKKRETKNIFEVTSRGGKLGPSVLKIEFLPSKNYIAVLCMQGGLRGHSVQIINLDGEVLKEIEFITSIKRNKSGKIVLAGAPIFNFAVSPDSRKIVFDMERIEEVISEKIDNPFTADGGVATKLVKLSRKGGYTIYDMETDRISHVVSLKKLWTGQNLFWIRDEDIVVTSWTPIGDEMRWANAHVSDAYEAVFRR